MKFETKTLAQIIRALEEKAPSSTAESWDNTGLIVGHPDWKTDAVIISDDLTLSALEMAKKKNAKLIVLHHPPIFPKQKGISKLVARPQYADDLSSLMVDALQNQIGIAAYHTNFDRCALEVVHDIANGLGCIPKGRLFEGKDDWQKLVVFVPETHVDAVREAISEAGAGMIGNYEQCSFMTSGIGTFNGLEGSHPTIGKPGKLEKTPEIKLETILPRALKSIVLKALTKAHPYEEVAYDLYDIDHEAPSVGLTYGAGYGFWGEYEQAISFETFSQRVKEVFEVESWLETANPVKEVKRIAFSPGKGSSFISSVLVAKGDIFVTGEVGYHAALDGSRKQLKILELGHRESEKYFLNTVHRWITQLSLNAEISNPPTQNFRRP